MRMSLRTSSATRTTTHRHTWTWTRASTRARRRRARTGRRRARPPCACRRASRGAELVLARHTRATRGQRTWAPGRCACPGRAPICALAPTRARTARTAAPARQQTTTPTPTRGDSECVVGRCAVDVLARV